MVVYKIIYYDVDNKRLYKATYDEKTLMSLDVPEWIVDHRIKFALMKYQGLYHSPIICNIECLEVQE